MLSLSCIAITLFSRCLFSFSSTLSAFAHFYSSPPALSLKQAETLVKESKDVLAAYHLALQYEQSGKVSFLLVDVFSLFHDTIKPLISHSPPLIVISLSSFSHLSLFPLGNGSYPIICTIRQIQSCCSNGHCDPIVIPF